MSIHEKSESYDDRENIVLIVKGSYAVHVQWVGPKNLLVRCPECNQDDVFKQVAVWQGIEVAFELAPAK